MIDITEQVTKSVGGYVNGMVVLALINATLGFIMMTVVGVPFAGLVAVGVFMLALIPLIGSVLATVLVTAIALFNSPVTALVAAIYYLIYMQLESYLLTPRIMNRVVSVPGSLVVIGALAGGTLLGLLGALIAIPVTAAVLMIIKQVWVPRQNAIGPDKFAQPVRLQESDRIEARGSKRGSDQNNQAHLRDRWGCFLTRQGVDRRESR